MFTIPYENADIPYIKTVAYRDGYSLAFRLEGDEEGEDFTHVAVIGADESLKQEFLEDVQCERECVEFGGLPVYSLRTVSDPDKLGRLIELNQIHGFAMLKRDETDYLKM